MFPSVIRSNDAVRERKLLRVGDLVRDARRLRQPPRLLDHLRGQVGADDLRIRKALGDESRDRACACAEVEHAPRPRVDLSSAASTGASVSGPRIVVPRPARACRTATRSGRRKSRHSIGRRTTMSRDDACEALADASRLIQMQEHVLARLRREHLRSAASVDRDRDVAVRVFVEDDLARVARPRMSARRSRSSARPRARARTAFPGRCRCGRGRRA